MAQDPDLISCIMPTYGRPDYLDESVAMFLAQDHGAKELIVLNDCPGQTYRCDLPGVRVVNAGRRYATLGEKRNAAIGMAEGGIIAVWDDDDVYLPWRLSFSLGEMRRLGTEFYRPAEFWAYWGESALHDNQSVESWVSHGTALFTKDLWGRAGGYPHRGVGEDAEFFARVHRELGRDFIKYPIMRDDRFFVLRGKSFYHHMSINGGEHPPDTGPMDRRIEPLPVRDPVLHEACRRLEEAHHRRAAEGVGGIGRPVLSVCVSLRNRSRVIHGGRELDLFPNCVRSLAEAARRIGGTAGIELVVADFGSDDRPLALWLAAAAGGLPVRVVEAEGDFSRGKGLNLAVRHARGEGVLLCDADMLLGAEFLETCLRHLSEGAAFFPVMRYLNPDGSAGEWEHLGYGIACLSRRVFEAAGGVPEFRSWGGEDDIFRERVSRHAEVRREAVPGLLHQWHPEECRHKFYVRPRKSDFEDYCKGIVDGATDAPLRVFWAEHPHWRGFVHLYDGGRMARPGIDGGRYDFAAGRSLVLRWDRWPPESLEWDPGPGLFASREKTFTLREQARDAGARPEWLAAKPPPADAPVVRTIHVVWVGDESMRPDPFIETWRRLNPGWAVRLWGNGDYESGDWALREHMEFRRRVTGELNAVADIMRWEILFREGGFAIDADGPCLRPLEDWLFEGAGLAAGHESETAYPGVVASGYVYAQPRHPVVARILGMIGATPPEDRTPAFMALGPGPLTRAVKEAPASVRLWPSHHFIPNHRAAPPYRGDGAVFAMQHFMSTHGTYRKAHEYRAEEVYRG